MYLQLNLPLARSQKCPWPSNTIQHEWKYDRDLRVEETVVLTETFYFYKFYRNIMTV